MFLEVKVQNFRIIGGHWIEQKGGMVGYTPLLLAAQNGRTEIIEFLVSKGSSLEEKSDNGEF